MPAVVIVGAQWGDEGKAKIIDLLAQKADLVVRYQGGCNAGHTVVRGGETFKFHLIPSGILYEDKTCVIGPGTVIAPEILKLEIERLREKNIPLDHLFISSRAHITFPYHIQLDGVREDLLDKAKIGTTRRGIGPTYEDKVGRIGIRLIDLMMPDRVLKKTLSSVATQKNPMLLAYGLEPLDPEQLFAVCEEYRKILKPYVEDTTELMADALERGQMILLEGAQGTMLDIDHGTYPYVTGSNPTAGGACAGAGIGPKAIDRVIGICKAYVTRVGEGPFPTELFDASGEHLAKVGVEFGTTTGRARRCGWFDAVAMRYSGRVNSLDGLALTKLDVLSGLPEVKLCVAYKSRVTGKITNSFPSHIETLGEMEPMYETMPGWTASLQDVRRYEDLPVEARNFLKRLSEVSGVPVSIVSVGPDREQTILVEDVMSSSTKPVCSV